MALTIPAFYNFSLLFLIIPQSQSLKVNLETNSFPLADHLTEVVEGKILPNSTIQRVAIELLQAATTNITRATDDMNSLSLALSPQSPLPPFLRIFDMVELYR